MHFIYHLLLIAVYPNGYPGVQGHLLLHHFHFHSLRYPFLYDCMKSFFIFFLHQNCPLSSAGLCFILINFLVSWVLKAKEIAIVNCGRCLKREGFLRFPDFSSALWSRLFYAYFAIQREFRWETPHRNLYPVHSPFRRFHSYRIVWATAPIRMTD